MDAQERPRHRIRPISQRSLTDSRAMSASPMPSEIPENTPDESNPSVSAQPLSEAHPKAKSLSQSETQTQPDSQPIRNNRNLQKRMSTQNPAIEALVRHFQKAPPPPLAQLIVPVLRPLNDAADKYGNALLMLDLKYWRKEWRLPAEHEQRDTALAAHLQNIQWMAWFVVSQMLIDCPEATQSGISILTDASNTSATTSIDDAHIILIEFLKMTIPYLRINHLYILRSTSASTTSTWRRLSSNIGAMFNHFGAIMESFGVTHHNFYNQAALYQEAFQVADSDGNTQQDLVLPLQFGGPVEYDFLEWYKEIKRLKFSSRIRELIEAQEQPILDFYKVTIEDLTLPEQEETDYNDNEEELAEYSDEYDIEADEEYVSGEGEEYASDEEYDQQDSQFDEEDEYMVQGHHAFPSRKSSLKRSALFDSKSDKEDETELVAHASDPPLNMLSMEALEGLDGHAEHHLVNGDRNYSKAAAMSPASLLDDSATLSESRTEASDASITGEEDAAMLQDLMSLMDKAVVNAKAVDSFHVPHSLPTPPLPPPPPPPPLSPSPPQPTNNSSLPPPPPPPPVPSTSDTPALAPAVSSLKPGEKILRFKQAVQVHRYDVPPREEWASDVWWTDEDDIGVLEDWEEEKYGVAGRVGNLMTVSVEPDVVASVAEREAVF
ncbi:hypothetical protein CcCBS67573_g03270 [Chytriomyces confervae]|uniref:Uncharacterized protein n=1 Tax=Chytriomyces confervae TaxID=246404 RepID=A0A507FGZ6_9FUNG|nr:hypothetical protein CcCBS67573_g03270 [Chytriomyces confervae]